MRFDPQTITVTDNKDRTYTVDTLAAVQDDGTPVGLAVHPVYDLGPGPMTPRPDEYTLTHIASGVRLHHAPVPNEAVACYWLTLVAPLADWRQSGEALRALETLRLRVGVARVQAMNDCEDDLDLSGRQERSRPVASPPTFTLDALTPLIEWISHGMEYVALPQEARPALDTLLAFHTELAQQIRVSLYEQGLLPATAFVVS